MNIANKITIVRFILVPVFVVCFYLAGYTSVLPAIVFIIAALTDAIDGHLARSRNLITDFGKFMDPLADKILTQSAFILLTAAGRIPAWIIIVIVSRELAITGLRTIAASNGVTIAASKWGKMKTIFQMIAIIFCLFEHTAFFKNPGSPTLNTVGNVLIILALIFTIISGMDYLIKNKNVLDLDNV